MFIFDNGQKNKTFVKKYPRVKKWPFSLLISHVTLTVMATCVSPNNLFWKHLSLVNVPARSSLMNFMQEEAFSNYIGQFEVITP